MDQLSTLQVRDRALKQVLDALPTSETGSSGMLLSWRPDGRVLAAFNGTNVDLYDCATGRKLASLIPRGDNAVSLGGTDILRWSPDGSRLLLSSVTWGQVSLWEPGQLLK